jgi:hypothetical protein
LGALIVAPREPITFAGCSGACQQGRLLCPHPEACEIAAPDDDDDKAPMDGTGLFLLVLAILVSWAVVLGIVHVGRAIYRALAGA